MITAACDFSRESSTYIVTMAATRFFGPANAAAAPLCRNPRRVRAISHLPDQLPQTLRCPIHSDLDHRLALGCSGKFRVARKLFLLDRRLRILNMQQRLDLRVIHALPMHTLREGSHGEGSLELARMPRRLAAGHIFLHDLRSVGIPV